jgi:chemotaxis protein CheX
MDASYLNPFLKATNDTLTKMLSVTPEMDKPILKRANEAHYYDVSGVITISGEVQGTISISFEKLTALKVATKMRGESLKIIGPQLMDAIGEIANIIAGSAKQYLTQTKITISLPNVVIGRIPDLAPPVAEQKIIVPFKCELGVFAVEVALKT